MQTWPASIWRGRVRKDRRANGKSESMAPVHPVRGVFGVHARQPHGDLCAADAGGAAGDDCGIFVLQGWLSDRHPRLHAAKLRRNLVRPGVPRDLAALAVRVGHGHADHGADRLSDRLLHLVQRRAAR